MIETTSRLTFNNGQLVPHVLLEPEHPLFLQRPPPYHFNLLTPLSPASPVDPRLLWIGASMITTNPENSFTQNKKKARHVAYRNGMQIQTHDNAGLPPGSRESYF